MPNIAGPRASKRRKDLLKSREMPNIAGPRASKRRLHISAVANPIHPAPVWFKAVSNQKHLRMLERLQRTLCFCASASVPHIALSRSSGRCNSGSPTDRAYGGGKN
ncbi:hypothetical protein QE152_g17058 [Popillia japonica]|uniref:Ribosomal protein S3 n=1 Tax=Popillia japonica TaxID=7064 RepID=A0AAW1L4F1_POPJA